MTFYLSLMILKPLRLQNFKFGNTAHYKFDLSSAILFALWDAGRYKHWFGRFGKRKHSLFEDPVGHLLAYLCELRHWCNRLVAIAHNARGFDAQFILQRAILLKWRPELNLSDLKIIFMMMEHLNFIDRISYIPMPLRKQPESFGSSVRKSWYSHYFNTKTNLNARR